MICDRAKMNLAGPYVQRLRKLFRALKSKHMTDYLFQNIVNLSACYEYFLKLRNLRFIFLLLGHSPAEDYLANPDQNCLSVDDNETREANSLPLSLKEQIGHKNKFLEGHISTHSKIILIGHSIGAYVILNLLRTCQRASDITKAFLLFPTVERMAISPSGRYVSPMVTYFKWLAIASSAAFSILPAFVKEFLVRWWLNDRKRLSLSSVESILKLLTPQSIDGVFTMAQHEMKEVVDLDDEVPIIQSILLHCINLMNYLLKPLNTLKNCRLERISLNFNLGGIKALKFLYLLQLT